MFSPSGKLTHFCRDDRIEEIITRFANTPQHERSFENVEVFQKLTDERGLEAPGVGAADLQQEVQELRSQLSKTVVEGNFFEQKARLFEGQEYISSFNSPTQLVHRRSELVQVLEKVQERMGQQGPVVRQNIVQQTSLDNLDTATSMMANSEVRLSSGSLHVEVVFNHKHHRCPIRADGQLRNGELEALCAEFLDHY